LLSVGCVTPSTAAALRKLPASQIARTSSRSRMSMEVPKAQGDKQTYHQAPTIDIPPGDDGA
jgi:hypothetical protein